MDPFLPDVKPGIVVPVIGRIAVALQSCNIVRVLFRTAFTEMIWNMPFLSGFLAVKRIAIQLRATFFTFGSAMGTVKKFSDRQNFMHPNQFGSLFFFYFPFVVNAYDVGHGPPLPLIPKNDEELYHRGLVVSIFYRQLLRTKTLSPEKVVANFRFQLPVALCFEFYYEMPAVKALLTGHFTNTLIHVHTRRKSYAPYVV